MGTGCAVEFPDKQEILLIGGDGPYTRRRILNFDIETQSFERMNVPLIRKRRAHTCARVRDTSEILNLNDNTIRRGNPMNTKRSFHGMAVITIDNEDRLAVFGGE